MADDLLIYGKDRATHDGNMRKFLKRACECKLKLNKKKCRCDMTELPYIGHILTSEGVKPDPKKVRAINDMETPRNSGRTTFYRSCHGKVHAELICRK